MRLVLASLFTLIYFFGACQEQDTVLQSKIYVENANNTIIDKSGKDIIRYFRGDVRMYKDSVFMFCDSARMINNNVTALGNVVFVQTDTIKIFCDSLIFKGDSEIAYLFDEVTLENGKEQLFTEALVYDAKIKRASYQDTALLRIEKTLLQSKRGFYMVDEKLATFFEEVVLSNEDLRMRTDSLEYNTELEKAFFVAPTRIVDLDRKIYCEDGYYDFKNNEAEFLGNPQLIEKDDIAIGQSILYNGRDSILTIIGDASFERPDQIGLADQIVHNIAAKTTEMKGKASFVEKETGKITKGEILTYNGDSDQVSIKGDALYQEGATSLVSEQLDFNEETGEGRAQGDVIYRDSSADLIVYADDLLLGKNKEMTALGIEQRPYIVNLIEADSMFLVADTLLSFEHIVTDSLSANDTFNVFYGYRGVNVLKSDFTAVCDSLSFSSQDSIFRLFDNPVVWSDSTQFSGDTILIYLRNNKIDQIDVNRNGFIINELEEDIYNQIKGKKIEVFFEAGEIHHMDVNGSAESLYYFQDEEKAYVGVNKTLCSHMAFYFEDKELADIKFFNDPESVLTPIQMLDPMTQRLGGFNWQIERSPINLSSIISID